jgi:hypothetical protein
LDMTIEPGTHLPTAGAMKRRRVPLGFGHEHAGELPFEPCGVEGCDSEAKARGLCWRHYKRLQRGRPLED